MHKSAKKKKEKKSHISHLSLLHLFFSCDLSRCISFSAVTELLAQVIREFDAKTDRFCHRNQLLKWMSLCFESVMYFLSLLVKDHS